MRCHTLQVDLRAREGAEIQKKGKPREGCKERDGTVKMTSKENDLGSSTRAVCKQGKIATVRVQGDESLAVGPCREV